MNNAISPAKEVVVTMPDDRGLLSNIATTIAEANVNIRAICAYATDNVAHVRLLTDNNARAIKALKAERIKAEEHDIFLCEISPSSMHTDIENLVSNYEVKSNYWCAATRSGEHAVIVFSPKESFRSTMAEYT